MHNIIKHPMAIDKNDLAKEVTKKLVSSYTLEGDFVGDVENLLVEVFAHYYVYKTPAGKGKGKGKGKAKDAKSDGTPAKPRKTSAYNHYVSSVMTTLKETPPKDRMKKIGEMWKALDAAAKAPYQKLADDANIASGASDGSEGTATVVTATQTTTSAPASVPASAPATASVPASTQAAVPVVTAVKTPAKPVVAEAVTKPSPVAETVVKASPVEAAAPPKATKPVAKAKAKN